MPVVLTRNRFPLHGSNRPSDSPRLPLRRGLSILALRDASFSDIARSFNKGIDSYTHWVYDDDHARRGAEEGRLHGARSGNGDHIDTSI